MTCQAHRAGNVQRKQVIGRAASGKAVHTSLQASISCHKAVFLLKLLRVMGWRVTGLVEWLCSHCSRACSSSAAACAQITCIPGRPALPGASCHIQYSGYALATTLPVTALTALQCQIRKLLIWQVTFLLCTWMQQQGTAAVQCCSRPCIKCPRVSSTGVLCIAEVFKEAMQGTYNSGHLTQLSDSPSAAG